MNPFFYSEEAGAKGPLALPAPRPRLDKKPAVTGELMLDGTMDKYPAVHK